jgi:hypothetical protein
MRRSYHSGTGPKAPGPTAAKPSGDHIPLGGFVGPERQSTANVESSMRHVLMRAVYLAAIAVATIGWLWFLVWAATQLV